MSWFKWIPKDLLFKRLTKQTYYFIHVIDDCSSRKVVNKWCNRRTSEKALSVLKEWIELYGKPMKVMHDDGGREFTSNKLKIIYP